MLFCVLGGCESTWKPQHGNSPSSPNTHPHTITQRCYYGHPLPPKEPLSYPLADAGGLLAGGSACERQLHQ